MLAGLMEKKLHRPAGGCRCWPDGQNLHWPAGGCRCWPDGKNYIGPQAEADVGPISLPPLARSRAAVGVLAGIYIE